MNGPYETELEAVKAARVWETQGAVATLSVPTVAVHTDPR